jgi:methylmalonyl-CoA mutase C-terminal domain/subunit
MERCKAGPIGAEVGLGGIVDRERIIRVLMAKMGRDVHDIALRMLAKVLRDAGMEIIYLGIHQTPETIVTSAVHESVDVIGISSHCGIHIPALTELVSLLNQRNASDIAVVCGGMIPAQDRTVLRELNIKGVFGPGTPFETIIQCIENIVGKKGEEGRGIPAVRGKYVI